MAKKRWRDLPPLQRRILGVAAVAEATLKAAALIDLRRRPPEQIRGPKRLWAAAAFINLFGPAAYFIAGRKRAAGEDAGR